MKTLIYSAFTALLLIFTDLSIAQSIPALITQNGKPLTAVTRATPPINTVSSEVLSGATALLILNEQSMEPVKGNKVQSFTMTVVKPGGVEKTESESNLVTDAMKLQLQRLNAGDKVYFEYIKSKQPNGIEMKIQSMAFLIQ